MQENTSAPRGAVVSLSHKRVERVQRQTEGEPGTLAHAWRLYEAGRFEGQLRPKTREAYHIAMRYALTMLPPRATRGDVEKWLRELVQLKGLAVATANMYLRAVKAVLNRARWMDLGCFDVCGAVSLVRPLTEAPRAPRCPPDDALWRALDALPHHGERAFVLLCASGLRRSEVMALREGDYDQRRRKLAVTRQREGAPRKNKQPHFVTLGELAHAGIVWAIEHTSEMRSRSGWSRGKSDGYLFPWSAKRINGIMERVRASLGDEAERYFPRGTAYHGLRHLGATFVARQTKGDPQAVQCYLGDKTPHIAQTYCAPVRGVTTADAASLERAMLTERRQGELLAGRPALTDLPAPPAGDLAPVSSPGQLGETTPTVFKQLQSGAPTQESEA